MRHPTTTLLVSVAILVGACGGDDGGELFPAKPECKGTAVEVYAGNNPQVISKLEIGAASDGFDLDKDGKPDNKLASVAMLASGAISDAIKNYEIVIPIEFFDLQGTGKDECVKFAMYYGAYGKDSDGDGKRPFVDKGDCNDKDPNVSPGAAEIPCNRIDDDCNGMADDGADTVDHDGDGQSISQGDCDDTNNMVKKGMAEICGDGLDNDCDGVADRTVADAAVCSPFNPAAPQDIALDPLSLSGGAPVIVFNSATVDSKGLLHGGPSIFSVNIPVALGITLDLRISGATIEGQLTDENGAVVIKGGRLGGVIDGKTADTIRGLNVDQIGLKPENSLLDATFANVLGPLLVLPKAEPKIEQRFPNCRTPDIDVDGDGLEAFCDSCVDPAASGATDCPKDAMGNNVDPKVVDTCIDGDGTEFKDVRDAAGAVTMQCSEALKGTKNRFVDGISVELNFETSAIKSIKPPK